MVQIEFCQSVVRPFKKKKTEIGAWRTCGVRFIVKITTDSIRSFTTACLARNEGTVRIDGMLMLLTPELPVSIAPWKAVLSRDNISSLGPLGLRCRRSLGLIPSATRPVFGMKETSLYTFESQITTVSLVRAWMLLVLVCSCRWMTTLLGHPSSQTKRSCNILVVIAL